MAALSCLAAAPPAPRDVDLLITRGTVYVGDTSLPTVADIGIVGDRIVFVGDATKAGLRSRKTLDANGLMVMPGLIDAHTHVDDELASPDAARRRVDLQLMQGVTTSIVGVDGDGTPDTQAAFAKLEQAGIGQNIAAYVGFGAIRQRVLHDDAWAPTPRSSVRCSRWRRKRCAKGRSAFRPVFSTHRKASPRPRR